MSDSEGGTLDRVIENLNRLHELDDRARAALRSIPFKITSDRAGHYLVREGARPESCCMLLDGYACRHKTSSAGERQIVSFHIPGDMLDVQHLELECADHNVQTITQATVAWVTKSDLQQLIDDHLTIRKAVWRNALVEASIFREWVLNVGRREAVARVAHMLCEFAARREAVGLGSPNRFELPMTQEQIGDATGLTPVADHGVRSHCTTRIVTVAHADLLRAATHYPEIGRAFWFDTLIDAAIFREWTTNVGRRNCM